VYRPLLGILIVALDSLSIADFSELSGQSEQVVHDFLGDVKEIIDPDEVSEGRYRVFHTSFSDFLAQRSTSGSFWIDVVASHCFLAKRILRRWSRKWPECPDYPLAYVADHLALSTSQMIGAKRQSDLQGLLLDYSWLYELLKRCGIDRVRAAYGYIRDDPSIRALAAVLRLSAHVLAREPARLAEQLVGRLEGSPNMPEAFLRDIREKHQLAWLRPLTKSLPAGGLEQRTLIADSDCQAISFAQNENYLASGYADGSVILWDIEIGKPEYVLRIPDQASVTCVSAGTEGILVAGSATGQIITWDIIHGTEEYRFQLSKQPIAGVAIDPEGKVIAVDAGGVVYRSGRETNDRPTRVKLRPRLGSGMVDMVLSADGCSIGCLFADASFAVWDLQSGSRIYRSEEATDNLWNQKVALSPDGKIAVSTFHDGLLVHQIGSKAASRAEKEYIFHFFAAALCVGGSGHRLYWIGNTGSDFGGNVGPAMLEGYELPGLKRVFRAHGSAQTSSSIASSKSDTFLAYSYGTRIKVLKTTETVSSDDRVRVAINRIFISPDQKTAICTVNADGAIVYDLRSFTPTCAIDVDRTMYYRGPGGGTYAAAFSRDGKKLVVGSNSGVLCLVDVAGELNAEFAAKADYIGKELRHSPQGSATTCIAFLDEDAKFAAANGDGKVYVWDYERGEPIFHQQVHSGFVTRVIPISGTSKILSCATDGTIVTVDWKSGIIVSTVKNPGGSVNDASLVEPNTLWFTSKDNVIRSMDIKTSNRIYELSCPPRDDGFIASDTPWRIWTTRVVATRSGGIVFTTPDNQVGFLAGAAQKEPMLSSVHRGVIRDLSVDGEGARSDRKQ
jgi:WD40 repeat protein